MTSSLIRTAIRVAVVADVVYWLARIECDFSMPQAIFLTVLAALSVEAHFLRHSAGKRFKPFQLWLQLKYRTILTDAGVLANEGDANEREWAILTSAHAVDDPSILAARAVPWDGTTCYVLSYNFDSGTHLIAWPESKAQHPPGTMPSWPDYSSRLTFWLGTFELESLPLATAYPAGGRPVSTLDAEFIVKPGPHGLHIVMCINDIWWKARWAESSAGKPPFSEHRDPFEFPDRPAGNLAHVELTVAVIPHAELQCLYRWKPTSASVSSKRRRRTAKALGWTIQDSYMPGGQDSFPWTILASFMPGDQNSAQFLSHKYVEVSHEPIV